MEHVTLKNGKLFCNNCGVSHNVSHPIEAQALVNKTDLFSKLHSDCPKTYVEPKPDLTKGTKEKAMWWINFGSTGMSSKTMWNCFMGNKDFRINHPYDPDDFSRCYKLLEAVPEWKDQLHKLKPLSKEWSNLVDNWPKLTSMYEQNVRTEWKNSESIGMYAFMQTLIE